MRAYVIIDIDVFDPLAYEEYKKAGAPTILAHGGKPLVRGGKTEVLEGNWQPKRWSCLNSKAWKKQNSGGILRNTQKQKNYAIKLHRRMLFW